MERKDIADKVRAILADKLSIDISRVALGSDLLDDLGMDSMAAIEVEFQLKDAFDIEVKEESFRRIRAVNDIVDYVEVSLRERA